MVDLKAILAQSKDLDDLEDRLKAAGIEFSADRPFEDWLTTEWVNANPEPSLEPPKALPKELPGTEVQLENTKVILHGITHHQSADKSEPAIKGRWWAPPSARYKRWFKGIIDSYNNPPSERVLLEDGFAGFYGLDSSLGAEGAMKNAMDLSLDRPENKYTFAKMMLIEAEMQSRHLNKDALTAKALRDPRYQIPARLSVLRQSIPEPFNIQMRLHDEVEKFALAYSLSMVNFARDSLKTNPCQTLHYIVGCLHEPEMAYFFAHPEFIVPKIDMIKLAYSFKDRMEKYGVEVKLNLDLSKK